MHWAEDLDEMQICCCSVEMSCRPRIYHKVDIILHSCRQQLVSQTKFDMGTRPHVVSAGTGLVRRLRSSSVLQQCCGIE